MIMKKIFIVLTAVAMTAISVSAQDLATATETFNNGAMELQMDNKEAALANFQSALQMATALGEEGNDIAVNCKNTIPALIFSIAKDLIKAENFDGAVAKLNEAIASAKEYGNAEVEADAASFIPQVFMQQGTSALKAKDMATALSAFSKVTELDPTNGNAFLRLGMAYSAAGKTDEAVAAYESAAANGEEKDAMKQLSTLFVRKASAALKGKNYAGAVEAALKSNEYLANANAMKIAGTASQFLKKNADAITYLKKYLELAPTAKDGNKMKYTIAALAQTEGDKETAKAFYQQILSDPNFGATAAEMLKVL